MIYIIHTMRLLLGVGVVAGGGGGGGGERRTSTPIFSNAFYSSSYIYKQSQPKSQIGQEKKWMEVIKT